MNSPNPSPPPVHPAPLLARLGAGRGLARDVISGVALLSATLVLWGWFALALVPPAGPQPGISSPATEPTLLRAS